MIGEFGTRHTEPSSDALAPAPRSPASRTGELVVDEVLDSVAGLAERPVADHVAVYDLAHQNLLSALVDDVAEGEDPATSIHPEPIHPEP